jgi:hypothetical protein
MIRSSQTALSVFTTQFFRTSVQVGIFMRKCNDHSSLDQSLPMNDVIGCSLQGGDENSVIGARCEDYRLTVTRELLLVYTDTE